MHYRPQRGALATAMRECVEMPATLAALRDHLRKDEEWFDPDSATVTLYSDRPDDRIGWTKTYLVTVTWRDGTLTPCGYTDEMPRPAQGNGDGGP